MIERKMMPAALAVAIELFDMDETLVFDAARSLLSQVEKFGSGEYRCLPKLGFGGKIFAQAVLLRKDCIGIWFSCYPEDATEERAALLAEARQRLLRIAA